MSRSDSAPRYHIRVRAGDAATELFLIDARFQVVAGGRGIGTLDVIQPPGIYTVRVRAGDATDEQMILVEDADVDLTLPPLAFSTPVPAEAAALAVPASTGTLPLAAPADASIFVCVNARDGDPFSGLVLQDETGREVAELGADASVQSRSGAGNVGTSVTNLRPGPYRLALAVEPLGVLTQTVMLSKGWRTNVFLRQVSYSPEAAPRADLVGAAILLSPQGRPPTTLASPGARLVELARLALKNRRNVLSPAMMETLLHGKFEDPMMGIFGGHLLLLRPERDLPLLTEVVKNLRTLVGTAHPDVEALAYALGPDQSSYVFTVPPMLRLSWQVALITSASRPGVIPAASVAAKAAEHIYGEDPWLVWNQPAAGPAVEGLAAVPSGHDILQERLQELVRYAAERFPDSPLGRILAQVASGWLADLARGGPRTPAVVQKMAGFLDDVTSGVASKVLGRSPTSTLDPKDIERLVRRFGIPRSVLDAALKDFRQRRA